jgi:hypothetical protein
VVAAYESKETAPRKHKTQAVQTVYQYQKRVMDAMQDNDNPTVRTDSDDVTEITHIYTSIKRAPQYPQGFKPERNGIRKVNVEYKALLGKLRQIEAGRWRKVYKDGYDADGNKVSIHYFESRSGKVFDVGVKSGWSNS